MFILWICTLRILERFLEGLDSSWFWSAACLFCAHNHGCKTRTVQGKKNVTTLKQCYNGVQAEKMRLMKEAYAEVVSKLKELKSVLVTLSNELYEEKELTGQRVKHMLLKAMPTDTP